jgi:hypothetical protein
VRVCSISLIGHGMICECAEAFPITTLEDMTSNMPTMRLVVCLLHPNTVFVAALLIALLDKGQVVSTPYHLLFTFSCGFFLFFKKKYGKIIFSIAPRFSILTINSLDFDQISNMFIYHFTFKVNDFSFVMYATFDTSFTQYQCHVNKFAMSVKHLVIHLIKKKYGIDQCFRLYHFLHVYVLVGVLEHIGELIHIIHWN